jgi:hypothetical protein
MRAGIGSAALVSLPALAEAAWARGDDDGRTNFYFVALSSTTGGFGPETLLMSGCGSFSDSHIRGGGEFNHFDGTNLGTPANLKRTGSWRATRFLSFQEFGTWGVGVSGVLETEIKLIPCDQPVIRGAVLRVVCNLGPAGIFVVPAQPEGFTLTLPGPVTFSPFAPSTIGLTLFTRPCREGEHEDD